MRVEAGRKHPHQFHHGQKVDEFGQKSSLVLNLVRYLEFLVRLRVRKSTAVLVFILTST